MFCVPGIVSTESESLNSISYDAVIGSFEDLELPKIPGTRVSITICQLDSLTRLTWGHYQGNTFYYPASVVKLFHLVYCVHLIDSVKLKLTPELDRALSDMIRKSSNDATSLVVDTISNALGGPELTTQEIESWFKKRTAINCWFESDGYCGVSVCQKTWNEDAYGRESQARGAKGEHRNCLSSSSSLQLLTSVMQNKAIPNRRWLDYLKELLMRQNKGEMATSDS